MAWIIFPRGVSSFFSRAIEACEDFGIARTSIYLFIDRVYRVACVCLFYMRGSVCSMRRAQPRVRDDTSQIEHHPSVLHLWRSGLWNSGIAFSLYLQSPPPSRYPSMAHNDLSAVWPDVIESSRAIFHDDTNPGLAELAGLCKARCVTWSELFVLCQIYYSGVSDIYAGISMSSG